MSNILAAITQLSQELANRGASGDLRLILSEHDYDVLRHDLGRGWFGPIVVHTGAGRVIVDWDGE